VELRASTGIDIEFRQIGIFVPFFEPGDRKTVHGWARLQRESGVAVEVLDWKGALEAEPLLADKVTGAIRLPESGHVNPRTLVGPLAAAARRHGGKIVTGSSVQAIIQADGRVSGVRSGDATVSTRTVILAAGSWSSHFADGLGIRIPVVPVRGQLLLVRPTLGLPRHIVFSDDAYLFPTPRGETILGITVESVGYDKRSTVSGVQAIMREPSKIIPSITDATLVRA
jgi:glycine oxidase